MRPFPPVGLGILLSVACLLPASAVAQPVTAEAAIAAELEISTADTRIGVLSEFQDTYTYRSPDADSDDVSVDVESFASSSGLIRRLWARAHARGDVSLGEFTAIARSTPELDLVNGSDETVRLYGFVHLPDRILPDSPGDYFFRATVEEDFSQVAIIEQRVNLLTGSLEGSGDSIFFTRAQTRPATGAVGGPRQYEVFGVPFSSPVILDVPPSFREYMSGEELIIEIEPFGVKLAVHAEAVGMAPFGSTTEPLIIDQAKMAADRSVLPLVRPLLPQSRLCRINRRGASPKLPADAPLCTCLRDDALRSQRCTYLFSDLAGLADLTSPLKPGEDGQLEWTFRPVGAAGGAYEMAAALFLNGKWVPVKTGKLQGKGKAQGRYAPGLPIRERVRFTAPETPTVLRTTLRLWPEGAKKPIESTSDVFVALRKPLLKAEY